MEHDATAKISFRYWCVATCLSPNTVFIVLNFTSYKGETPSKFASLQNPANTRRILSELPIREAPSSLALLCLNDDVGYGDWKVGDLVQEWLGEKWPKKAEWEK